MLHLLRKLLKTKLRSRIWVPHSNNLALNAKRHIKWYHFKR